MASTKDVSQALRSPQAILAQLLLEIPEDQWYERQSAQVSPQVLANQLVGFANSDGGTIVIGLSEGRVQGTDEFPGHRNELMQAHLQHCQPPVPAQADLVACVRDDGETDQLLVLEVRPG